MRRIPLTGKRKGFALVDNDNFDWLAEFKWNHLAIGYAARYEGVGKGRSRMIYMHREILGFPRLETDHINGNKLDNRRANLRVCSRRTNATNSGKRYPRGRYGRNVCKMGSTRKKPYHIQCWFHNKPVSGGYYETAKEARIAAAKLRKELGYVD